MTARSVREAVSLVSREGIEAFIDHADLEEVRTVAKIFLDDKKRLQDLVAGACREKEGLEALVRGMVPPNAESLDHQRPIGRRLAMSDHPSFLSPPRTSAGAPGLAPSREPKGRSEASGLPADIQSAMRVIDALRSCAETLEDAADHLADVVDRQLQGNDLP